MRVFATVRNVDVVVYNWTVFICWILAERKLTFQLACCCSEVEGELY